MGNWRTVHLIGTIDPAEVEAVRAHVTVDRATYANFGPLTITDGLCGLGDWPAEHIDVSGNLAERDYSVNDIAEALQSLATVAPSLRLKVHCGDDWESEECIATLTAAGGQVREGPPEVATVTGVSEGVMMVRLFTAITRPREQVEP